MLPVTAGTIGYHLLTQEYLEETVNCVSHVWVNHNVIARAFGIDYLEYLPVAQKMCQKAVIDGLGIIAIDLNTNKIIGFDLNMDLVDEIENEKSKGDGEKYKMWGDFLLEMLSLYKENHASIFMSPKRGEVLCHNLIGVLPTYQKTRGNTIGHMLLSQALKLAQQLHYRHVISIATNIPSQRISETLGFHNVGALQYSTCTYPPLQKIVGPTHAIIYLYEITQSKL
eukprot:Phypoly_transcript_18529.p1 GENE.Phypoly_transcript_18529~~Phypoly_transcript_18529.p1  ORF type:complete len:226 (+),score=25.68 Phypoly_transcript_18529:50-727(+)